MARHTSYHQHRESLLRIAEKNNAHFIDETIISVEKEKQLSIQSGEQEKQDKVWLDRIEASHCVLRAWRDSRIKEMEREQVEHQIFAKEQVEKDVKIQEKEMERRNEIQKMIETYHRETEMKIENTRKIEEELKKKEEEEKRALSKVFYFCKSYLILR